LSDPIGNVCEHAAVVNSSERLFPWTKDSLKIRL